MAPTKKPAQTESAPQPTQGLSGTFLSMVEKHGLATVLLLFGGYYIAQSVVTPMVQTAQTFVADIREVNQEMERAYLQAQAENLEKWRQVWDILAVKQRLLEDAVRKLERLDAAVEDLGRETEKLRMLMTKPELPNS